MTTGNPPIAVFPLAAFLTARLLDSELTHDSLALSAFAGAKLVRVEVACQALNEGKRLKLAYDGWCRTVEVHAVGFTKEDRAVMRVWQTGGGRDGRELVGWKLLHLDDVVSARMGDRRSAAPKPGYNRDDRAMDLIVCQL